jgi:hypothetical protein
MENCFCSPPSLPTHRPYFFQLLPFTYCHALCTSDASFLRSVVPPSLTHYAHFTTCACTVIGRLIFFAGGNKEAAKAQLFVLALYLASSARTHHTLARARVVLTMISVVVKFI